MILYDNLSDRERGFSFKPICLAPGASSRLEKEEMFGREWRYNKEVKTRSGSLGKVIKITGEKPSGNAIRLPLDKEILVDER